MFFQDQSNKPPDAQCLEWATRLYNAVRSSKRAAPKSSHIRGWAKEFAYLKRNIGEELTQKVLHWYCENITQEYMPHAFTGKNFRVKFDSLKRRMETSDTPEVDERSKSIAQYALQYYTYPPEISGILPLLVQTSRKKIDDFWSACSEFGCTERESQFLKYVTLKNAPLFIEQWIYLIHKKYGYLDHYLGQTKSLYFSAVSELFRDTFWRGWSQEWTGNPNTFDDLLTRILEKLK